ncbi:MAG: TetR/AcrR family transcriptional regulator [Syntrophomonas sp.]
MSSGNSKPNKRALILTAAVQVFSQKGYHNTRMEEIAVAAGVGKGTIYEYFISKVQLFQEMLEGSLQAYSASLSPQEINRLSIKERINRMLEGHFKFCLENRELAKIIFWDQDICDQELKEWAFKSRQKKEVRLQAIIEEGIKRGEVKKLDVKLAMVVISGILGSIWVPIALEDWEIDPRQAAAQVTDIILNGIGAI